MILKNKKILIVSPNNWGDMHISKHHYANELQSRGNEVYFLNPPSLENSVFSIEEIKKNLFLVNYYPLFRGNSFLPEKVFNWLIQLQIKVILKKIKVKIDILWSFSSNIYFRLDWFKAGLTIFHPVDQLNSAKAVNIGKYADYIFTCSDYIMEELSSVQKPTTYIPHGISPKFVDYEFMNWVRKDTINVCYVGNLFIENLDRVSLKTIIDENPEHHFHFIGAINPEDSNISAWKSSESAEFIQFLLGSKNITCHGVIKSSNIPALIAKMDAFLVCYKSDGNNVISNSHKVLEYLATGRLVISTFIKQYKNSNLLEMLEQNDKTLFSDFYSQSIKNIAFLNSLKHQKNRVDFAKLNSYSAHVDTIGQILEIRNK